MDVAVEAAESGEGAEYLEAESRSRVVSVEVAGRVAERTNSILTPNNDVLHGAVSDHRSIRRSPRQEASAEEDAGRPACNRGQN